VTACRCDGHVELVAITISVSSTRLDEQTLHISTRRSHTPDVAVESDFGRLLNVQAARPRICRTGLASRLTTPN
jgi:hypothetical protein